MERHVPPAPPLPRPGRPREARVDQAVIAATCALLRDVGYARLSMDAIARRAGVARGTLYRRWHSKALLVYEAVFTRTEAAPFPDTGGLEGDLRAIVWSLLDEFAAPEAVAALPGLLADLDADQRLRRAITEQFLPPAREYLMQVFARAQARGEVAAHAPVREVFDALAGAVFVRALFTEGPLDDELGEALVALMLRGVESS